jgi:threonine aldolase
VPFHRGWLDPEEIEAAVRGPFLEATTTGLICVENTSNIGGGAVIPSSHLARISDVAKRHALAIHMDGARFFNAVVASGQPALAFTQHVDTLAFCLSKGLGAPYGGLFCGAKAHVELARTARQMLGGGMRQAGVIAAAGVVALETGIDRLAEDHANAKKLALGLAEMFPGCCDPDIVETNLFHITPATLGLSGAELSDLLGQHGIRTFAGDPRMRFSTHRDVTSEDIDRVLEVFNQFRADVQGRAFPTGSR